MNRAFALSVLIAVSGLGGCAVQAEKTQSPIITDLDGPYLGGERSVNVDSSSLVSGDETSATQLTNQEENNSSSLVSGDEANTTQTSSQEENNLSPQALDGGQEEDTPMWVLNNGLLKEQVVQWGRDDSTWDVIWKGDADYYVEVSHIFHSSLDEAVIEVVKAFASEGANIRLDHVKGNHQLIIWARGE